MSVYIFVCACVGKNTNTHVKDILIIKLKIPENQKQLK